MKIILLSGGSGKRLWPLSNNQRSKQFIKILQHENTLESMVQRVWNQLQNVKLDEDTIIATGSEQKSILKSQLNISDKQILVEPSRRDTFPAISLAASYLHSELKVDEDEVVVVSPVDPYVSSDFFESFKKLEQLIQNTKTTLGLIGIKPLFPSEKYGYILPEFGLENKVKGFKEKPNVAYAAELISDGAMWNAGVFAFKLGSLLNILREKGITVDYSEMLAEYKNIKKTSFDYEVVEYLENISFIQYDGYWKDLGTWNTLSDEMNTNIVGENITLIDSNNTHVINDLEIPVVVLDSPDSIVAVSNDGILVSSKDASPRVKEIPSQYFENLSYLEEDWGIKKRVPTLKGNSTRLYVMQDNKKLEVNLNRNEKIIKVRGEGEFVDEDNKLISSEFVSGKTYSNIAISSKINFAFMIVSEDFEV